MNNENERVRFMVTMERKRLDALDARARRLNTTRTALINQLVEDFLQSHRATPSTVATTTAGIVGSDAAELLDRLVALTSALSEERERLNVKIDALGRGLVSVSKRLNDEARAQRVEPRQTMRERVAVSARQYRADNLSEIEAREQRATETTSGQGYREHLDAYVERVESMTVDNVTPTAFDFSRYEQ